MTLAPLPEMIDGLDSTTWKTFAPYYEALLAQPLDQESVGAWLAQWSHLSRVVREAVTWVNIEKSQDTGDAAREQASLSVANDVYPQVCAPRRR